MEFKQIDSLRIPTLGIGTWWMGGKDQPDFSEDEYCIASIKRAIEHGMNHIDTAEYYGNGHAEELVRAAIQGFPREKLFIASKAWQTNLAHDDVLAAAEKSMKRLNTEYLDLYMPHWPSHDVPISETMKAMDQLVEEKKVRYLGLSNFSLEQMKEAQSFTKNKIVATQVRYNLQNRDADKDIIPYCQKNGIFFVAYRPLDKGTLLTEKATPLSAVAQKYKKTPAQVALNWVIHHPNVVGICKTIHVERVDENAGAIGWKMEQEDIERLEREIASKPTPLSATQLKKK